MHGQECLRYGHEPRPLPKLELPQKTLARFAAFGSMGSMETPEVLTAAFDAPWKIALERFLEPFLRLCFPKVHAFIDWSEAPVFLDPELQQIAPEHQEGPRSVDKLVRVRLKDGQDEWLLIHVEVQAQPERRFAERMFVYFCRIWDRFGQRIVSLAVLAGDDPDWRPQCFHTEVAGCVQHLEFPTFKVLDCSDGEGLFERTGNVFGLLVAAHRVALATRRKAAVRCEERFRLVKYLYRHGLRGRPERPRAPQSFANCGPVPRRVSTGRLRVGIFQARQV